ncbi:CMD domain protein [Microbacterium sp. W4I4]|uniref:CMD domain protein n=1 Tax=Microbacterium sp. W4I4 TaxID=3042295 RepID=UPI00278124B9|nr:CMD domain protein [Microbacterium sp. W4I4]MDQ0612502.1 CMD domain protein [Microbacterium sp. W4I4]
MPTTDVIDTLVGIEPGDRLDQLRARRPEARQHAQGSYDALFRPTDDSDVSLVERAVVAAFVARVHGESAVSDFYAAELDRQTADAEAAGSLIAALVAAEGARAAAPGPYGAFHGDIAGESTTGPEYVADAALKDQLGGRLSAALEHAHLLVFHPRDSAREHLGRLLAAGWSTTGIVTLSQLVSFLTFQIRVVHGLRVLNAGLAAEEGTAR